VHFNSKSLEEQNTGENTNNTDSLDSNEDRIYSILTNFLARTLSTKDTNEEKTDTNEEKTLTKKLTKKEKTLTIH
jgi:hypothetical protein